MMDNYLWIMCIWSKRSGGRINCSSDFYACLHIRTSLHTHIHICIWYNREELACAFVDMLWFRLRVREMTTTKWYMVIHNHSFEVCIYEVILIDFYTVPFSSDQSCPPTICMPTKSNYNLDSNSDVIIQR
jgi:hypothetical protein